MACEGINSWTLSELVCAFLDLSIAYCLLCASAFSYLASKFLGLFGLSLPCPCDGLFWNPGKNTHCYKKISLVHSAVRTKAPFETLWLDERDNHDHDNSDDGDRIVKLDPNNEIGLNEEEEEGESGGAKGKRVVGRRIRSGLRRRQKLSSASSYDTLRSDARNLPQSPPSVSKIGNEASEDAIDFEGSYREASTDYGLEPNDPNELGLNVTVKNTVWALEQALEEEHAARSALYVELEKERSAAASAADEAMAMISRLQEEKASIEMEARQYHRMIEAKANYDAEEMNILKEILLRREREKHFLEKELESIREIMALEENENENDRFENSTLAFENELTIPEQEVESDPRPSFVLDPESLVHDVHVIDEESNSKIKPWKFGSSSFSSFENISGLDITGGGGGGLQLVPPPRGGHCRGKPSKVSDLRRNSMSAVDCERVKIDNEVEWLRGRLRVVQEGREKLHFSAGHKEREKLQLQLLDDIAGQLREIRHLNEPGKASLPPSYSKVTSKKRCWRSASLNVNQST